MDRKPARWERLRRRGRMIDQGERRLVGRGHVRKQAEAFLDTRSRNRGRALEVGDCACRRPSRSRLWGEFSGGAQEPTTRMPGQGNRIG